MSLSKGHEAGHEGRTAPTALNSRPLIMPLAQVRDPFGFTDLPDATYKRFLVLCLISSK